MLLAAMPILAGMFRQALPIIQLQSLEPIIAPQPPLPLLPPIMPGPIIDPLPPMAPEVLQPAKRAPISWCMGCSPCSPIIRRMRSFIAW